MQAFKKNPSSRDPSESSYQDQIAKRIPLKLHKIDLNWRYGSKMTQRKDLKSWKKTVQRVISIHRSRNIAKLSLLSALENDLKVLGRIIGRCFQDLSSLDISFSRCYDLIDVEVEALITEITRYLPKLQHMRLDFYLCQRLTEKGLKSLASNIKTSLVKLQSIDLNFKTEFRSLISDQGLTAIAQLPKHLTHLRSLCLDFDGCIQIADQGVENLAFNIYNYSRNLQKFVFNFRDCNVTKPTLDYLIAALSWLSRLKQLSLKFNRAITDEELDKLTSILSKYLTQLQQLTLIFDSWTLTDEGLEKFSLQLCGDRLIELRQLEILCYFSRNSKISDKGVESLALSFRQLSHLQKLCLRFPGCRRITEKGVTVLANELATNLTRLQSLNIYFDCLNEVLERKLRNLFHFIRDYTFVS